MIFFFIFAAIAVLWLLGVISVKLQALADFAYDIVLKLEKITKEQSKPYEQQLEILKQMEEHLRWVALVPERQEKDRRESLGGMPDPIYDKWFYEKEGDQ